MPPTLGGDQIGEQYASSGLTYMVKKRKYVDMERVWNAPRITLDLFFTSHTLLEFDFSNRPLHEIASLVGC